MRSIRLFCTLGASALVPARRHGSRQRGPSCSSCILVTHPQWKNLYVSILHALIATVWTWCGCVPVRGHACLLSRTALAGGTQRHVWELARHLQNQAIFLLLTPLADHCVRVQWLDEDEGFAQDFHWPTASDQLVALLRALGVCHVHYHHFLGLDTQVMYLHERLGGPQGVSYDFTVHDYYSACPETSLTTAQKTYCGERGVSQCTACLQERPAATQETIDDWRLRHRVFLHQARYVLTPSVDAAVRMQRYFPQATHPLRPPYRYVGVPKCPGCAPLHAACARAFARFHCRWLE